MKKQLSPRSRRIRRVLIPLNLVLASAMLISLTFGTPMGLIAAALVVTSAASIIAVLIER